MNEQSFFPISSDGGGSFIQQHDCSTHRPSIARGVKSSANTFRVNKTENSFVQNYKFIIIKKHGTKVYGTFMKGNGFEPLL